ncbi:MAG TPA: hypothetical protein VMJ70_11255 [Candidatus Sulfotelmatobacter sp.]|nr:hypothetical protein [Candidatus Sulfotelmatobacter sp.]
MTISVVLQAIATATFVLGALFTVGQLRLARRAREREVALEILRLLQTPEFVKALRLVYDLEPGLSRSEVEARLGDDMNHVYAMMVSWESLGVLVYRRQLALALVDDFVSGSVLLSWRKLERYVIEERAARGRETLLEWFQWLAERMIERETKIPVVPAYRAHAHWRP